MSTRHGVQSAFAILLLVVLTGCSSSEPAPADNIGAAASAAIVSPEGEALGTVTLTQGAWGVLVAADLTGLTPGAHGFHIHETGTCQPDFAAAGDHFNPGDVGHGYFNSDGTHAGDMPNIHVTADGTVRADVFNEAITLETGKDNSVFDADGSAIIVHEKADTYGAEAGAGGRVGCGVIS